MRRARRSDEPGAARLEVLETSDPRTLRLLGKLDLETAGILGATLETKACKPGDLTLDLSGLDLLDTSGIRVLVRTAHALGGNGSLILRSPGVSVARMLTLAGVGQLPHVEIVDSPTVSSSLWGSASRPTRRLPPMTSRIAKDRRSRHIYAIER